MKGKSLSRVRLFVTPWTVAYYALPSMGFSRQECWSGVPLPSPKLGTLDAVIRHSVTDAVKVREYKLKILRIKEKAMAPHSSTLA